LYRNASKLEPYLFALTVVGLDGVAVTPGAQSSCDGFSGLLLTGGTDVDPALYGQNPHHNTQNPDRERDDFEMEVVQAALSGDLPVLAICRGMQLLNVMHGGRLIQDLPDSGIPHVSPAPADAPQGCHEPAHSVEFQQPGRLQDILQTRIATVNSRHHQAVERPGEGIVITGRADDGVVESCEMPAHRFVIGVQWHPENRLLVSDADRRLFEAFAAAIQQP